MGITSLGVLGVVWGATCLGADEEPPPPATVEELDTRLEEILKDTGTPGLIGTIVVGDEVIWTGAIGIAERESNRAVTPATRFRVGSITKSFTSLAALILMERGQLDLEQTLHDFIPEAGVENRWRSTDPVRLFHVLEHTAGFDDIHVRDYAYSDPGGDAA